MIERPIYLTELKKWVDKPQIKIITGIRRSGKSMILELLRIYLIKMGISTSQIIYLNFESISTEKIKTSHSLNAYFRKTIKNKKKRFYILLDEIQEVKQWEKVVNSLLVDYNVDVYITGSNSHLLSSELATLISGRYVQLPIYTLSYKEFIEFRNKYPFGKNKFKTNFDEYLNKGGFPVIYTQDYDIEAVYKIVQDVYASVILYDTVKRHHIRDIELLERVIRYVFDNIGFTFSGKKIADYFNNQRRKVDINTIYNYLYALEGAFVIYRVSRYDIKGKEILKTQEKFYVSDLSLIYSLLGFRGRSMGGLLENLVFLELKRRDYKVHIGKLDTKEIDFVAEKQGKIIYIQVTYKLENEATIKREFEVLKSIKDHYPKYVVSLDDFWKDNIDGIQHFHLNDFLLSDVF
ncbi:MAG: ATP-binding protein [Sediminibacterium sp.]|nr:ATP-binding protein [Sediminibacterium sp.]